VPATSSICDRTGFAVRRYVMSSRTTPPTVMATAATSRASTRSRFKNRELIPPP
jgi:hypothetical protein